MKNKIKKVLAILCVLMLISLCACKNKKEVEKKTSSTQSVAYEDVFESAASEQENTENLEDNLTKTIKNTEFSKIKYSLKIPNWNTDEKFIKEIDEVRINEGWKDFNVRMYDNQNTPCKLFVGEYTGRNMFPSITNSTSDTDKVLSIVTFVCNRTIDLSIEGGCEKYSHDKYQIKRYKDFDNIYTFLLTFADMDTDEDYVYAKGCVDISHETPILIGCFDFSKNHDFDGQVVNITQSITDTLVIE